VGEGVHEPVAGWLQACIWIDVGCGVGESTAEVALVRFAMRRPDRGAVDPCLPVGDGFLVKLQEDAFAAVLGGDCPAWARRTGERCEALGKVSDAIHVVYPGKAQ
jgi:hypothetical protein